MASAVLKDRQEEKPKETHSNEGEACLTYVKKQTK